MPVTNRNPGAAPGQPNTPGQTTTAPAKKPSPFWAAVKWLAGGAVLGIASYEGLRFYKRMKGEKVDPDQPALNPGDGGQRGPSMGGMGMGGMPQMMPFPMPMPYPLPTGGGYAAAPPQANPAPPAPVEVPSAKQSRADKRQQKLEQRLAAIEAELEDDY